MTRNSKSKTKNLRSTRSRQEAVESVLKKEKRMIWKQEAFEKCWAHSPLRATARPSFTLPFTRCRTVARRHCRTPPAHRCPRRRRRRQRVTEGTAMAPWNGPNEIGFKLGVKVSETKLWMMKEETVEMTEVKRKSQQWNEVHAVKEKAGSRDLVKHLENSN